MKILLLGKNGQVGRELQRSLAPLGKVVALAREEKTLNGDLANLSGLEQTIRTISPTVIVNAAAYTAVDRAEGDEKTAQLINAQAPEILAQEAKKIDALLIHYSTDYVFNGGGDKPWNEGDVPSPLNIYGKTKLAGEHAIQSSQCRHFIFRCSWVYAAHGHNFINTILRLAKERDNLSMVGDQIGAPTGADLIADVTAQALRIPFRQSMSGVYHLAAEGEVSWFDYARFILNEAIKSGVDLKMTASALKAILTSEYPTPARRPLNSRLDTKKIEQTFGVDLPNWQVGVSQTLSDLIGKM